MGDNIGYPTISNSYKGVNKVLITFGGGRFSRECSPNFALASMLIDRALSENQPGLTTVVIRLPESLPVSEEILKAILSFLQLLTNSILQKIPESKKKSLYEHFRIHKLGEVLPSLVLVSEYFEVVDDFLIKALTKTFEKDLLNRVDIDEAKQFFGVSDTFSDEEKKEIQKENPFHYDKIYKVNGLLYNSLPDIKRYEKSGDEIELPPDIVKALLPRKPETSLNISTSHCHKCKSEISGYLKTYINFQETRHHCRDCGLIFCSKCSSEQVDGTDLKKQRYFGYFDSFYSKKRVCVDCANTIRDNTHYGEIVKMLEILSFKFDILRRFAAVCPKWRKATILYLSNVRMIQYSYSNKFSVYDKKVLWRNRDWFQSHSLWMLKLLTSIDYQNKSPEKINKFCNENLLYHQHQYHEEQHQHHLEEGEEDLDNIVTGNINNNNNNNNKRVPIIKERMIDCYFLMCSSSCKTEISCIHVVPLLDQNVTNLKVRQFAVKKLEEMGEDIQFILPQLVYLLRYEPVGSSDLSDFLFRKAAKSSNIAYSLLWELKISQKSQQYELRYEYLKSELIRQLTLVNPELTRSYVLGFELPYILQQHPISDSPDFQYLQALQKFSDSKEKIKFPGEPDYYIDSFNISETKIKNSATKPMVLSCNCIHSKTGEKVKRTIMFKKDDVRVDQLILNLISVMSKLLEHPPKKPKMSLIPPVTYRIQPTGNDYGFIQMVENATTLNNINNNNKDSQWRMGTYLHYCQTAQGQQVDVKKVFSVSLATWIIITHLLGVGDRHDENVMVTNTGQIFHIDYGFILGREPKPISNYIRFDKSFQDVFSSDPDVKEFRDTCVEVFGILRKEPQYFLYHLLFLTRFDPIIGGRFDEKYIEEEVAARFLPGFSDEDASNFVRHLLTSNFDSFTQNFVDFFRAKKNSTTQTLKEIRNVNLGDFIKSMPNLWNPSPKVDDQNKI
ncbi:phosphatidylinositol 3-kinase [Tieghemostelium lacteum]|uniref:Phosphatidylinositol 3-kinase n=1 Tax=Tieghemostelium lacteum TaxID=361077 RepID=A0A151ZCJ9_TIELA|nr:phosphatidylinositol 3-kinase [Tieghemostelium lacteum]|eukprot:KYQ91670.1 phosphatidylinositol 3-kinase [Tieghemostelium lacteum]